MITAEALKIIEKLNKAFYIKGRLTLAVDPKTFSELQTSTEFARHYTSTKQLILSYKNCEIKEDATVNGYSVKFKATENKPQKK